MPIRFSWSLPKVHRRDIDLYEEGCVGDLFGLRDLLNCCRLDAEEVQ